MFSVSLQIADVCRCLQVCVWTRVFLPACSAISGRVESECERVSATVVLQDLPDTSFTANYITANSAWTLLVITLVCCRLGDVNLYGGEMMLSDLTNGTSLV